MLETNNITMPAPNQPKNFVGINKNAILSEYQESCIAKGIHSKVSTIVKGKNTLNQYPPHHCLTSECRMKPSLNHQYQIKNLHLDNIILFLIKNHEEYLTSAELSSLKNVHKMYILMINNVLRLRSIYFSTLKLPRFDDAKQTKISQNRVDLAGNSLRNTLWTQHRHGHPISSRRVHWRIQGCKRNHWRGITQYFPHQLPAHQAHHDQGCPSHIDFEEDYKK